METSRGPETQESFELTGESNPRTPERRTGETESFDTDSSDTGDDATVEVERRNSRATIEELGREEIERIITTLSRRYSVADGGQHPGGLLDQNDPTLDPQQKHFDLSKWLRHFIQKLNDEGHKQKHTGLVFKDLSVSGSGEALQLQKTVGDLFLQPLRIGEVFRRGKSHKQILHNFNGLLRSGELLIVLGRPGSGCSTLLKSMCGELYSLDVSEKSIIQYNGIPQKTMVAEFKGEMVYNQEVDKHFPHLTVGQTLEFAASSRTPSRRIPGMSRDEFSRYVAQVVMAVCSLSHTYNTKVGDDFVRGVSGGERKRVSIAEMMVAGSAISAWDNSTRGLDSATALKFAQSLRLASDFGGSSNAVAIYQASQAIYDVFDKATVLYEGRQIYFGPAEGAKGFFERQGWFCPQRQTTGDFLTSVTNPLERKARPGMENAVPRTPQEFENYWRQSPEFEALQTDIIAYEREFPVNNEGQSITRMRDAKNYAQAKYVRPKSAYLISVAMQVRLTTRRAYQRIWNDKAATLSKTISTVIVALIVGSVFYGGDDTTATVASKGLYSQRPIVEKHASYRFYHPATEAIAGVVSDIPIKFITAVAFNTVLYFLGGLRREPGQFFLYFLVTYMSTFVMSAIFRTMAAVTKTVSQAMSLAGVLTLALVIYTGFIIAVPQMHPWFGWIRFVNPIFYAFEMLVANEFHGREIDCATIVPSYTSLEGDSFICSAIGAVAGQRSVNGDAYISTSYQYSYDHVWRNFGILVAFLIGFMMIYFVATELNSSTNSAAEMLVFQRGRVPAHLLKSRKPTGDDVETAGEELGEKGNEKDTQVNAVEPQKDIFTWRDVVYDIEIKGEPRRLLDNVSGWVKPGTLTALMGVSGAGKTTLLDVLAQRTSMGVITGDMFVNGAPLDASFQRKTGYVQQQDLHLETATVRESLRFSAMLRQPSSVSTEEKYRFVEDIIRMLSMEDFADAVVGVPGEGLNVEQRKLLTIGVELAAKPQLLLFLDEPTSGLDSQSSWAICAFLRKLADSGQAVLCTIHQPSAVLFQEFDRLLFLAKGGKTVYFGDIGKNSRTLLDYFESNGARACEDQENPAEYMLEIVNQGNNSRGEDWHSVWNASQERQAVESHIDQLHEERRATLSSTDQDQSEDHDEFAAPFIVQLRHVTFRVFQQYWRMPSYIMAKWGLGLTAGLFIGFSFYQNSGSASLASMSNVIFGVFMVTTIFSTLVQQMQPLFITQRSLYEVRERPSKAYSWQAFLLANIIVEIPYQIVTAVLVYACIYYPIAGIQDASRQGLVLLMMIQFLIYTSTFAHMTIVALPDADTAGAIVSLLTMMSVIFCGVLQAPSLLPGFWVFMYRASPFTYWIAGIVSTQLHDRAVECSAAETSIFSPPDGQTCGQYLSDYLQTAPGTLQNPGDMTDCRYCSITVADQYLAGSNIFWDERWRNFGIMWVYIVFNVAVTILTYYFFRVAKLGGKGKKSKKGKNDKNDKSKV
ncbi:ABC-2 type transporter-domain-containing protein [Pseudomassariella vexata]|uniref:ABC-2 type transporter-domain-containing protein n=1 Tax=Pseudomassariella vexata TaxID=1141098 RepID=A0A1Y2DZW5_9PEZI|nr:ABC-2 type transporter-domain-containing protein [Pseudomassariella vexata]ORY64165.1 ABC-2 type transporter-domain-containing protein [Pseudomassariella vexata]